MGHPLGGPLGLHERGRSVYSAGVMVLRKTDREREREREKHRKWEAFLCISMK